jgi:hypothetical protein
MRLQLLLLLQQLCNAAAIAPFNPSPNRIFATAPRPVWGSGTAAQAHRGVAKFEQADSASADVAGEAAVYADRPAAAACMLLLLLLFRLLLLLQL